MSALRDTHALFWWLDGDERMSLPAREWTSVPDPKVLVSAASAWEIATKVRIGKLPGATITLPDDGVAVGYRMHVTQRFPRAGFFNSSQLKQEA